MSYRPIKTWEVVLKPAGPAWVLGTVQAHRRPAATRAARKLFGGTLKGQEWSVRVKKPAPVPVVVRVPFGLRLCR